jgi:hypothetical protein
MRTTNQSRVLVVVLAAMWLVAGAASADTDGLVFRALGFYRGKANVSDTSIECEVPTQGAAITDTTHSMGLWNTGRVPTTEFPDRSNPFANPCGGYLQLQNNILIEGINVDQVSVKLRIPNARRFSDFVPTRKSFPLACRQLRHMTVFAGTRLDPVASETAPTGSGLPNVAFVQLVPLLTPQVVQCLQDQYGPIPTASLSSLPVVVAVRASGTSDSGKHYSTNSVRYTLTLNHLCGNGRVDNGEECDPNAANTCLLGSCSTSTNTCGNSSVPCTTDADCVGTCLSAPSQSECTCVY